MIQATPRIPGNLSGLEVGVYGLGVSGAAAARWLARVGARVRLLDDRPVPAARLEALGLADLGPASPPDRLDDLALLVVSPGIPPGALGRARAAEAGVPVLGELALAARDLDAVLTVVTGSHGKSTVTELIAALLRARGASVAACGNLGRPLADLRCDAALPDEVVVEASSFQLHDAPALAADRVVFTAYAPNHLDWHPDEDHYREAKLSLLDHLAPGARVVYLPGFPGLEARIEERGLAGVAVGGAGPWTHDRDHPGQVVTPAGAVDLRPLAEDPGRSAALAALAPAVALAAAAVDADPKEISMAVHEFRPLPHRMEALGTHDGVSFVNDSKATTPAAAAYTLERLTEGDAPPVVLLLGGKDKGLSFYELRESFARAHRIVATGAAAGRIRHELEGLPLEVVPDFEEAVGYAASVCPAGGVVLLAPGCSSFDRFTSFEERGECFRQSIRSRTTP